MGDDDKFCNEASVPSKALDKTLKTVPAPPITSSHPAAEASLNSPEILQPLVNPVKRKNETCSDDFTNDDNDEPPYKIIKEELDDDDDGDGEDDRDNDFVFIKNEEFGLYETEADQTSSADQTNNELFLKNGVNQDKPMNFEPIIVNPSTSSSTTSNVTNPVSLSTVLNNEISSTIKKMSLLYVDSEAADCDPALICIIRNSGQNLDSKITKDKPEIQKTSHPLRT